MNAPAYFEKDDIAPETGHLVARSLAVDGDVERKGVITLFNPLHQVLSINMPMGIHEVVHDWVTTEFKVTTVLGGFFTGEELESFSVFPSKGYDNFAPPYNNTYKEADTTIEFEDIPLSMVRVEVGYSESLLLRDQEVWIVRGAPHVRAMLLVKWNIRRNNQVAGYLELHRPGVANPPRLRKRPSGHVGSDDQGKARFIHWLQDVPDQPAIVRQYCRYSGEIKTGRNIKEMVYRALHFAMSDPKGPVYLTAAREVLEEVEFIATALINAKKPLVITGYLGRNPQAPPLLAELCDKLPINVLESVGSDMSMRTDHEAYLGVTITTHPAVCEADVILILDCDVPWIPTAGKPRKGKRLAPKPGILLVDCLGTTVFHLDVDPLKQQMPLFSINATRRLKVSCEIALRQLNAFIDKQDIDRASYTMAFEARANRYLRWRQDLRARESPSQDGMIRVSYLASRLRHHLPDDTVYLVEAVSNAGLIIQHLNSTKPGTLVGSGAGGLGWGGGAALGVKLAKPGAFLTEAGIDLNISFEPSPDYPGIATAAGSAWGITVKEQDRLDTAIQEAANVVRGGKCAVVEVSVIKAH
ncbi:hypothetical protein APSETT445_001179 [Aspergillus pseudonomiae]